MTLRATQQYVEVAELGVSKLRATQQYVEVAEVGDSKSRVTQQYVEVLLQAGSGTEYTKSVSDTMSLSDSGWYANDYEESITSAMSLTDTVAYTGIPFRESLADDVSITDTVVHSGDWSRSVDDSMSMTGDVSLLHKTPSDTMTLTDGVVYLLQAGGFQPMAHTMTLTQTATAFGSNTVEDPMTLTQSLGVIGPIVVSVETSLSLQDNISECSGAPWDTIEVSHTLSMASTVGIGRPMSVTDTLNLTDEAERVNTLSQGLNFHHIVSAGVGKGVSNTMSLSQDIDSESAFGRAIVHDNIVQDAMAYYVDGSCTDKRYNRFEGSGPEDGIKESPLTFEANFILETLSGAKTKLALRSPETDDRQRLGVSKVNRETAGGELNFFSDPSWPKISTLLFTIVAITDGKGSCPDKLTELMAFLQTNLGLEVLLHDWEGISWRGVITTPNEVAVEDRDGYWTFSFEFEGQALEGSQGDQELDIQDTVVINGDWARGASNALELEQTVGVSGILGESVSQNLGLQQTANVQKDTVWLSDNFSGAASTDLDGQSPDTGDSTWSAHSNYKADGSQTAINSGAYYPFAPESGTQYEIVWKPRTMTHSDGNASWFFLGEGLNSDPDDIGTTAWGRYAPTTLKAGFGIRRISGTQMNTCRLGDSTDGLADNQDMSDATLKATTVDIDLKLYLDTRDGDNAWKTTWYAKDPADSTWTEVRSEEKLLSEDITMVGWSNNNTTTVVDMYTITVTEKVSI